MNFILRNVVYIAIDDYSFIAQGMMQVPKWCKAHIQKEQHIHMFKIGNKEKKTKKETKK